MTPTTSASIEVTCDVRSADRTLARTLRPLRRAALGPLLVLELAAAVAVNALRARHVAVEGGFHPGEPNKVTTARVLAHACDQLVQRLNDCRRHILARLARERSEWPF